jgi:hypothetical protein
MCGYQQDTPTGEVIVQISTCVEKLPIRTKTNHSALIRYTLRKLDSLKLVHLLDGLFQKGRYVI